MFFLMNLSNYLHKELHQISSFFTLCTLHS